MQKKNIVHKLIPPGVKELQGLVERSHRQDDQELFIRISPNEIEEFNKLLDEHCRWRNSSRRFKKLLWSTPWEWLENYKCLLPNAKLSALPKSIDKSEILPQEKDATNCKDEIKIDDKNTSKRAA